MPPCFPPIRRDSFIRGMKSDLELTVVGGSLADVCDRATISQRDVFWD